MADAKPDNVASNPSVAVKKGRRKKTDLKPPPTAASA